MRNCLLCLVLLLAALPAGAEQYVQAGNYTVHYMSLQTSDLPPKVARAYGLRRSSGQALVMINVQRGALSGAPVPAQITGTAQNLTGVRKALTFREVREQDAIYSIATVPVANLETLRFALEVPPADGGAPIPVAFQNKFYR